MTAQSKGQKCAADGCITILGFYSGPMWCRRHEPPVWSDLWRRAHTGRLDSSELVAARAVADLEAD